MKEDNAGYEAGVLDQGLLMLGLVPARVVSISCIVDSLTGTDLGTSFSGGPEFIRV